MWYKHSLLILFSVIFCLSCSTKTEYVFPFKEEIKEKTLCETVITALKTQLEERALLMPQDFTDVTSVKANVIDWDCLSETSADTLVEMEFVFDAPISKENSEPASWYVKLEIDMRAVIDGNGVLFLEEGNLTVLDSRCLEDVE